MGTAQNKRIMIKYGLAVEKEAQKILDDLAMVEILIYLLGHH